VNGHAPENGYFPTTENRVNGYAPEKGARERACSGIQVFLLHFFVFSSCFYPIFSENGQKKRGFEGSTFNLKLRCLYSKVGGYTPEYAITLNNKKEKQNFKSEIDRFKQSADKIKVNLSDCEIISNNYTEQVEKVKSYKAQALDSIYDSGKNIEQVDINQTVIVYKTTQYGQKEQFNSSTINKDRITLNFLLAKHKETYLYVDRNNRQKYYFDIEFLNN
jgi:hypothetical protein